MNYKKLTACCGLDCFNCDVYEKNISDQMRSFIAHKLEIEQDKAHCKGCREQGGCILSPRPCATLECAKSKAVEFCYECDQFPCEKLIPSSDQATKYPHNLKIFNLCKISQEGLSEWAKQSQEIRNKYFNGEFVVGKGPTVK